MKTRPTSPSFVDFPLRVDASGRTATARREAHIRNLLEQVLFTSPGERVNRPSFGSGLDRAVFQPNSEMLAATTRMTTEAAIQQHLGHLVDLVSLDIETAEGTLSVRVNYVLKETGEGRTVSLERNL